MFGVIAFHPIKGETGQFGDIQFIFPGMGHNHQGTHGLQQLDAFGGWDLGAGEVGFAVLAQIPSEDLIKGEGVFFLDQFCQMGPAEGGVIVQIQLGDVDFDVIIQFQPANHFQATAVPLLPEIKELFFEFLIQEFGPLKVTQEMDIFMAEYGG